MTFLPLFSLLKLQSIERYPTMWMAQIDVQDDIKESILINTLKHLDSLVPNKMILKKHTIVRSVVDEIPSINSTSKKDGLYTIFGDFFNTIIHTFFTSSFRSYFDGPFFFSSQKYSFFITRSSSRRAFPSKPSNVIISTTNSDIRTGAVFLSPTPLNRLSAVLNEDLNGCYEELFEHSPSLSQYRTETGFDYYKLLMNHLINNIKDNPQSALATFLHCDDDLSSIKTTILDCIAKDPSCLELDIAFSLFDAHSILYTIITIYKSVRSTDLETIQLASETLKKQQEQKCLGEIEIVNG
ncbi:hypothetical protein QTN25_010854 [Entamoeba marina]